MSNAVELRKLGRRLGGRFVLSRLDLDVREGEILMLTGDNGAGKTTLLKVIATLLAPTAGTLRLFGEDTRRGLRAARGRLSLLTHATHLYNGLSAVENLAFVARHLAKTPLTVAEALARVELSRHATRPVATYSAGMRRRLTLARLLLQNPTLALLDEPWAELDARGRDLIDATVRSLGARGTTFIIATHDLAHAQTLATAHAHLQGGRLVS